MRFSDLLTQSEKERLDVLNKEGVPQYIRDEVNNPTDNAGRPLGGYLVANSERELTNILSILSVD